MITEYNLVIFPFQMTNVEYFKLKIQYYQFINVLLTFPLSLKFNHDIETLKECEVQVELEVSTMTL